MKVRTEDFLQAIELLTSIKGIVMDHDLVVEDLIAVAQVFNVRTEFLIVVNELHRALSLIQQGRVVSTELSYNFEGWQSHHFQSRRANGQPADMRIAFKEHEEGVFLVIGFGHRHNPTDFYKSIMGRNED